MYTTSILGISDTNITSKGHKSHITRRLLFLIWKFLIGFFRFVLSLNIIYKNDDKIFIFLFSSGNAMNQCLSSPLSCEFEFRSGWSVQHYVIKFVSDLLTGRWFSPGSPVSSTNITDRHDITEILLKVAVKTIKPKLHAMLWYKSIICYFASARENPTVKE